MTDQAGQVIERHDYLPLGEECLTGPCAGNPGAGLGQTRKFTGKERDPETGLDYFGARYYSGRTARFTSIDPVYAWKDNLVDPQRWNRYAYGRNNPLRYVDPDGKDVKISTPELLKQIETLAKESRSFREEYQAAVSDHTIMVDVQTPGVRLLNRADHAPGLARVRLQSDGTRHIEIWVSPRDDITALNEWGHVKDVRTNWDNFRRDGKDQRERDKPHDDQAVEKRANAFKDTVQKERSQYGKEEKQLNKQAREKHKQ